MDRLTRNVQDWHTLDNAEANRLVETATVARLIGHDHSGPTISIVRIVAVGHRIYFYVDGRSFLGRSSVDSSVVLEIDDISPAQARYSVIVVHGTAHRVGTVRRDVPQYLLPRPATAEPPLYRLIEVTPTSFSGYSERSGSDVTNSDAGESSPSN